MGNERRSPAGDGLDRTTHGFAVADELIQIPCATWDLGNRPITKAESDGGRVSSISNAVVKAV
jgi:hypothetical protein